MVSEHSRPSFSGSYSPRLVEGVCGDCWAISSLNALEMHLELGHRGEPSMVGRVGGRPVWEGADGFSW